MIVGIDASNLRAGGGVTHLTGLLGSLTPDAGTRVRVWAGRNVLERLPQAPWLDTVHEPMLDGGPAMRAAWQQGRLPWLARRQCDLLFAPGGTVSSLVRPRVTMCRNMLPFEPSERGRFGVSWTGARLRLLRAAQAHSFASADGLIYLTDYARTHVAPVLRKQPRDTAVIPHGVDERFRIAPRVARSAREITETDPLRVLYVSLISPYKHHASVARAISFLRAAGLPVQIDFVGSRAVPSAMRALQGVIDREDPSQRFLRVLGERPHASLPDLYRHAELFVFASSCENMPNILVEAMAAGLPIASSSRGPMPEVLGDGGTYFDPESPSDIADAVRRLVESAPLRDQLAARAFERARAFSWHRCAGETLAFLDRVGGDARAA